ncbi:hypothetical protein [Saccharothrix sp. NRRL B-16348]|uniref:hypothetical protein n=1 Tax=Saccharothrix sp. NRRL B-16348 TaxID=1415542 RepID=UPI0006AF293C|nr:hypothetical protein [Saccharothrix sp. NRRL B-16348]
MPTLVGEAFAALSAGRQAAFTAPRLVLMTEVQRRVVDEALPAGADTRDGLRRFLRATLHELTTSPLWSRLMSHPDEMRAVAGKLDPVRVTATSCSTSTTSSACS